jgi:uncharacterized C2H2 Zn-finger protein
MTGTPVIPEGSQPNSCPLCQEKFRYKLTLRRHIVKVHKSERNNESLEEWFRGLKTSQHRGSQ